MLHKPSIERVAASKLDGEKLVRIFEHLAAEAEASEEAGVDLSVYYIDPDDTFRVGEYVPELHLVVRRVEPDETEASDEG